MARKQNKKLRDLIYTLKDKINELDYEALVDLSIPISKKDVSELLEDISHLTLLIKVELVGLHVDEAISRRNIR